MLNIINKILIFIFNFFKKCNYRNKTFFLFNFVKKNKKNIFNFFNYLINNLNYLKKKIGIKLYLKICKKISNLVIEKNGLFIFSKKNKYINKLLENYNFFEIFFYLLSIKIKIKFNLKILKKIFTRVLIKNKKKIYEYINERILITVLYIHSNIEEKRNKIIFNTLIKYNDNNFLFFLKNIKRLCAIIHLNKNEEISNKMYLGFLENKNNNIIFFFNFIINYLINNNEFKFEISVDIYNINIIKILKKIKKIKKIKIFLSIGIPDLFIEKIIKCEKWMIFDSKKIKKNFCYYIQNFYDEYIGYGSFKKFYFSINKNKKIFKVFINIKKLFLQLINNNIKLFFIDTINRNNINKHISNIFPNFMHPKIFDKKNFFKKKFFFINNNNILIQKNNSIYLELKNNFYFNFCKFIKKKFFINYKLLDIKNEFCVFQNEIDFCINFRTRPLIIKIINFYYIKQLKEYFFLNSLFINCYFSKKLTPYCFFFGSDIYNKNFFYKNLYLSKKWNFLEEIINKNYLRNSLSFNFKIKKIKKNFLSFDNNIIKYLIIKWQTKNEKN